jgi:hypothetical protein
MLYLTTLHRSWWYSRQVFLLDFNEMEIKLQEQPEEDRAQLEQVKE